MEPIHSKSNENDIEKRYSCFKKRTLAGWKQKSSKKQKQDYSGSNFCYFFHFTLNPPLLLDALVLYNSTALRCGSFLKKISKKSTCAVMVKIIITFSNQIFL